MKRARAITACLWYGLLPSRCYEATPHYTCGYRRHLAINLTYAWRLLIRRANPEN